MTWRERIPGWLWFLAAILLARLLLMAMLPLADTSEPRYAEIARLMAETGDWITPWFEPGVPFWGKPPFAFWMSALSFRLLGYGEFAARLPAWLATLATLWLLYRLALGWFGARAARLAVLIHASSLLPFLAAGAVLTDAYLTLALTLSLVAFAKLPDGPHPLWKFGFFGGLALGLLAKGPLAPVLVLAVSIPWTLWHRLASAYARRLPWCGGILFLFTLTLPWYALAEWRTPGFLDYFLVGEHFHRFIDAGWQGDRYGSAHQRIYGGIWLDWLLASFPWGLVALWQLLRWKVAGGRVRTSLRRSADPRTTFLILWAVVTPLFFTLSGNILWTYVQPSLPALAILLAARLAARTDLAANKRPWSALVALVPLLGLMLGGAVAADPSLVKTEKALIEYYAAHAQSGQPLYYIDSRPFSARYYSHGQAGLQSAGTLSELLDQYPAGAYLAVEHARLQSLDGLTRSPVLFKSRRYSLVFGKGPRHGQWSSTRLDAQP